MQDDIALDPTAETRAHGNVAAEPTAATRVHLVEPLTVGVPTAEARGDAASAVAALCAEVASRLALLADASLPSSDPLEAASQGRLAELAASFGLDPVATSLVGVAAVAGVDGRFPGLFAGLDRSRNRPRPRIDVAFALAGASLFDPEHRAMVGSDHVLVRAGLITLHDVDEPMPGQTIGVPERVIGHLLGSDDVDPALRTLIAPAVELDVEEAVQVARALIAGRWLVWMRDQQGSARSTAATALAGLGSAPLVLDLDRLPADASLADVLPAALREAGLIGGGVVVGPVDLRRDRTVLRDLALPPIRPLVLVSNEFWDPSASAATPVLVDAPRLLSTTLRPVWDGVVAGLGIADGEVAQEMSQFRMPPDRAIAIGATAEGLAVAADETVGIAHLRAAGLTQGAGRLVSLAQRIVPQATIDDLVLPEPLLEELRSIPGRYRTRDIVRDEWGMDNRARGRGITCLFAGSSGTGKTLAAEVVAHELGVDLFVVDLSQIVDKYIGETEKNLERVFSEAEGINGVLLFDEADALFGKRSDVRGAHDRHANVEVAYLLQRMERYEGVAVLTTNLRNNIDEAFSRRLDVVCAFPEPEAADRLALWRRHLPATVPQSDDIDLDEIAEQLQVSGGIIRNIALSAAHAAAVSGRPIDHASLIAAARREYIKLGRLYA